jgi:uncharacterized protein YegL
MTDPNYTALLLVIDRSGSMQSIKTDMEGGLTTLLDEQMAEPGLLTVDMFTFDTQVERVCSIADPTTVNVLIEPRGSTALYDAIGIAVTEFGRTLEAMPEHARPETVQVIVVTDGHENASVEWRASAIKDLVTKQKDEYQWDFVFLGANQDAVLSGVDLGFDAGSSLSFMPGAAGVDASAKSMSRYMSDVRRKEKKLFMAQERIAALEAERDEARRREAEAQAQAAQDDEDRLGGNSEATGS